MAVDALIERQSLPPDQGATPASVAAIGYGNGRLRWSIWRAKGSRGQAAGGGNRAHLEDDQAPSNHCDRPIAAGGF